VKKLREKSRRFFDTSRNVHHRCRRGIGVQSPTKVVNGVEITDVRLRRVSAEGRMKAVASVTFDNEFVVHDIRVIDGKSGMFVAMPSKRTPDGTYRDIAHPISSAMRAKIQEAVLAAYARVAAQDEQDERQQAGA